MDVGSFRRTIEGQVVRVCGQDTVPGAVAQGKEHHQQPSKLQDVEEHMTKYKESCGKYTHMMRFHWLVKILVSKGELQGDVPPCEGRMVLLLGGVH